MKTKPASAKPTKFKRPNPILYFIVYILIYPILKIFYRMKVNRSGMTHPDGPYILLSNHLTLYDFLFTMLPLYPERLHAVAARKFFFYKPLHWMLPLAGCIPKNMFDPDVRSIIGIKTALKHGRGVVLYPEGRCSGGHTYSGIHKSTGKLLKKLGVPVISCYIDGAVNCVPLWRRGRRFGRIQVIYKNLFSTDDLESMSVEEINAAIDARLSGAEGLEPPVKPLETFHARRLAEGLHMLLYYCPACKNEFTTVSEGNTIRCAACGFSATINKAGILEVTQETQGTQGDGSPVSSCLPPQCHISEWFVLQEHYEMQALSEDMKPIEIKVEIRTPSPEKGGGVIKSGYGIISIDPKGWHIDGEINNEPVSLFFPVDAVPAISYNYDSDIQMVYDGNYYVFIPEDTRKCVKYMIIAECLHSKFASQPLLTVNHT